jgi:hypothetical protein
MVVVVVVVVVAVASTAHHVTGSNYRGVFVFFPVTKKMVTSVSKGGEDTVRALHWTQSLSMFSPFTWKISPINNKKYGTVTYFF